MKLNGWFHLLIALAALIRCAAADDQVKTEVVLTGLTNPCGVAVQPSTGAVFVSDTGAGQIVKFLPESPNASTPVITGFPQAHDTNSKEPSYSVGPLGLVFLNQNTLVAGEGALKQGDEVIRVFELPADGKALNFDETQQKLGPLSASDSKAKGSGNFFGLTMMPGGLAVTAHGVDQQSWVLKADLKSSTTLGELRPYVPFKADTRIDSLLGITINKHGFLVLCPHQDDGSSSGKKHHRQSLLSFYNVKNWNLLMSLPTELHNVTGLAYSPKSGRLYAADFAWDDPEQGGLYRLDAATVDGQSGVRAVKMASLDKPCALAFTSDNVLYGTVFGSIPKEPKTSQPSKPGKLIKITGDL